MKTNTLPLHFLNAECDGNLYDTRIPGWTARPLRTEYCRTFSTIETGRQFRATLRAGGSAWPGGYPLMLQTDDGAALCFDCGRSEAPSIIRSIREKSRDGWRIIGCFVHWEGDPEDCAHCGKGIPSAYGSTETEGADQ